MGMDPHSQLGRSLIWWWLILVDGAASLGFSASFLGISKKEIVMAYISRSRDLPRR